MKKNYRRLGINIRKEVMETHVPKQETCKKLKELGFPQGAKFYWVKEYHVTKKDEIELAELIYKSELEGSHIKLAAAPLATELLEWLPETIQKEKETLELQITKSFNEYWVIYARAINSEYINITETGQLPEALAQMLIYLVKNKIVGFKKEVNTTI